MLRLVLMLFIALTTVACAATKTGSTVNCEALSKNLDNTKSAVELEKIITTCKNECDNSIRADSCYDLILAVEKKRGHEIKTREEADELHTLFLKATVQKFGEEEREKKK